MPCMKQNLDHLYNFMKERDPYTPQNFPTKQDVIFGISFVVISILITLIIFNPYWYGASF